jgi:hypothetical protein
MKLPKPITYITRDLERAIGMDPSADYTIVANKTPYAEKYASRFPEGSVILVNGTTEDGVLGTRELMDHPLVKDKLAARPNDILVFKNTARVEEAATKNGLRLLNPKALLSETVENKMSQIEWLGELGKKYLPHHIIMPAKNLAWMGEPFIVQWAHGHTGGGTLLINSEAQLKEIQQKFPYRVTRRTTYIHGPSFTVNAIVAADKILVGNISYQITGIAPFTDNQFSTVGNDWGATHSLLNAVEVEFIETMASDIGKKLNIAGWRGLYGVDIIRDDTTGTIHLIEINARQPASTSFESYLQNENRLAGVKGITTFEAHLKALLGEKIDEPLIPINDGAQIVQRVTKNVKAVSTEKITALESLGYNIAIYPNTDMNEDLVRIQGASGIIETHGVFNARGKEIVEKIS